MAILGNFYGLLVYSVLIWYVVPRNIWQPLYSRHKGCLFNQTTATKGSHNMACIVWGLPELPGFVSASKSAFKCSYQFKASILFPLSSAISSLVSYFLCINLHNLIKSGVRC
jgi:hypothetical protein